MRAVVQRVKEASVTVDNVVVSQIGRGILALIGISTKDTKKDMTYIARKLLNLRIFKNEDGSRRWDKSIRDLDLELLCVSQFTLYSLIKGNKLDFHKAMDPALSEVAYAEFIAHLRAEYKPEKVKDGIFGAFMDVSLINDGPVTINLDSNSDTTPENNQDDVA